MKLQNPTVSSSPNYTASLDPTHIKSPTNTPVEITETQDVAPTPTAYPTKPRNSPTYTPHPKLPTEEAKIVIQDLFQTNGGCELPCWWGIMPGKTSWEQAFGLLDPISLDITTFDRGNDENAHYVKYELPEEIFPIPLTDRYTAANETVQSIEVQFGDFTGINLHSLDGILGVPSEIWLNTANSSYQGYVPFFLYTFYPKKGILIQWEAPNARIEESNVVGCPQEERYSAFLLFNPDEDFNFEEALDLTHYFAVTGTFLPLEKAVGINPQTYFTQLRSTNGNYCLETPTELWPAP